jgi:uncharacterized iron-regulated membrane protein
MQSSPVKSCKIAKTTGRATRRPGNWESRMLRKLHRVVGLIFAPFFLVTAGTGGILLFRRYFGAKIHHNLLQWHNWEGLNRYVSYSGVLLATGLAFMAVTGVALWIQIALRKRRARRATKKA